MKQSKRSNSLVERARSPISQAWMAGAVLVLLVTIVYWSTVGHDAIFDDRLDVRDNAALRSVQGLRDIWLSFGTLSQYYPLTYSTFWAEYQLWGLDWRGYHIVNLILHGAAAILTWRLLARLKVNGAWLAAAIFAVHPLEVESVAWISELKNTLSLVLALGSLMAYLRFSPAVSAAPEARERTKTAAKRFSDATSQAADEPIASDESSIAPSSEYRQAPESAHSEVAPPTSGLQPTASGVGFYLLAFALYVASLLAKTVTASVPAVLLVIYWWKRGRIPWRDAARLVPFFAVGIAFSRLTVWMERTYSLAEDSPWDISFVERCLIAGRALWFYVGKLCWPSSLMFLYPRWAIDPRQWWQYLFLVAAIVVLVGLWLARKRIGRGALAGVLIFAGVLAPALGFFNVNLFRYSFVADHLQYHAGIGLVALAAAALAAVGSHLRLAPWLSRLAVVGLLVPLGLLAHHRTHVFQDDMSLDRDIISQDPQIWLPQHDSAVYYQQQRAHRNLAHGYQDQGKYDEAMWHFRKAIEIQGQQSLDHPEMPNYRNDVAAYHINVGLLHRRQGQPVEEELSFRKAIEIREKLVEDYPQVNRYRDGLAWGYVDLAYTLHTVGRLSEALAIERKAIDLREQLTRNDPTRGEYQDNLAASHVDAGRRQHEMGRLLEAESSFRIATDIRQQLVRDHPADAKFRDGLAWCYTYLAAAERAAGRPTEAASSYSKAIEIRERLAQVHPETGTYKNILAGTYIDAGLLDYQRGQFAVAEVAFRKAIEIRSRLVLDYPAASDYREGLAWCYVDLALVQEAAGLPAEAAASRRRAAEIRANVSWAP